MPLPHDSARVEVEPDNVPIPIPNNSTRVEIKYYPSTLRFFSWFVVSPALLSSAEMDRLQSQEPFAIDNQTVIEGLSRYLRPTASLSNQGSPIGESKYIEVRSFRGHELAASLRLYQPDLMVTDDGHRWRTKAFLDGPGGFSPELYPLVMRELCVRNLLTLHGCMFQAVSGGHPPPAEWCDILSKPIHRESYRWRGRVDLPSEAISHFSCPSAHSGKCDYAMNPRCQPSSPMDTVLLFETTAGWNQHGGPDLFTFDNHYPRGGCVLLNGGTVMFVRTEEQLKQLRW